MALFGLNDKDFAADTVVSQACNFPILNDTKAANVYGLLGVPNKDFVYVWDKQGQLASLFAPWQVTLTDPQNVQKLTELLTLLAQ